MASLTEKQKVRVVEALAAYRTPSDVVKLVKDEFGVDASRQQVQYYDPTVGRGPAQSWKDLFWEARDAVQENTADRAVMHVGFRLAEYERMYRTAIDYGNIILAMSILKQAAKDVGGKFTNEHQVDHGGEVGVQGVVFTPPGGNQQKGSDT